MTTINLQLELTGVSVGNKLLPLAKDRIGFLSSITPDPILTAAFAAGTGFPSSNIEFDFGDANNYDKGKIKTKRNGQKTRCAVIATVGGAVTSDAIKGDSDERYVCLVGSPDKISDANVKGGVTLQSFKLNKARKNYLKGLSGGPATYNDNNIFLYTNKNSEMHGDETAPANWTPNTTIFESSAGITGGTNDPTKFAMDFVAGGTLDTNAKGLIISDDPFFRSNRAELIKQVNSWLSRGTTDRYAIYPSQMYGSPVLAVSGTPQVPTSGQSTLYGPDLIAAYQLLGTLARCSFDNETASFGFVSAIPFVVPL
jgi:hypothetical protein